MPFPEAFLEELSARNDIVSVVSGYVSLTKRTGTNLFGLCPFHSEKTPSFSVNVERQIFHCFGCGKGGGVISFVMEMENLSFPDAVRFLAARSGMEVPEDEQDEQRSRRSRMLELNREAARFFYRQLLSDTGKPGQDYVLKRGIADMVKPFGLGYAPDRWDTLTNAMTAKGYTARELTEAGLARVGKNGGLYDYFRNRLIFPVIDVRGSVIGFSGRILGDGEPKYLNSPDTLVYSKSRSLFALNLAKKSKCGYILLVEGNIDVVSLHQAGFDCAVASLGTALTAEQARLLHQYTNEIVISYDSDSAGQKAIQRAIGIFQPLDMRVRVLRMPGAKDPDEFIQNNGPGAFRDLIEKSGTQLEYRMDRLAEDFELSTDEGRVAYLKEAARLIASLPNEVEREVYGMRAAEKAGVSHTAFQGEVARMRKKALSGAKKQETRDNASPARTIQPKSRELHYDNIRSAAAERGVIALLYRFPEQFSDLTLTGAEFTSAPQGRIYDTLLRRVRNGQSLSLSVLGDQFSKDELSLLADIISKSGSAPAAAGNAMRDYINTIRAERTRPLAEGDDILSYSARLQQKKRYGDNDGT